MLVSVSAVWLYMTDGSSHHRDDCSILLCGIDVRTLSVLRGKDLNVCRARQLQHCTSMWLLWLVVEGLLCVDAKLS